MSSDAETPSSPLWSRVGFMIRRLHQISVALFHREMDELGLTPVQLGALTVVIGRPAIDQSMLGAELGIDRANGADVVARLVRSGLLRREVSTKDRRMRELYVTPEGERLVQEAGERLKKVHEALLSPLDETEKGQFLRLVGKLVEENNVHGRAMLRLGGDDTARPLRA